MLFVVYTEVLGVKEPDLTKTILTRLLDELKIQDGG